MAKKEAKRAEWEPSMAIKLRMESSGFDHVQASIFMGRDMDHLICSGQITVYPHEWGILQEILKAGCQVKQACFQVQYLPLEE